ncbi:MAG: SIS domain-containing protein [Staphylothermus sp.]|nr:SIS domain-containing protein [Staphylothermus sp.]
MDIGKETLQDISEIPSAVHNIINRRDELRSIANKLFEQDYRKIFLIGCGTSFYIGIVVANLLKRLFRDRYVYALPSSELLLYDGIGLNEKSLIIGFSRSGNTAETVSALEFAKKRKARTILLSITRKSKGSEIVDDYIYLDVGIERSIVMTKSFVSLSLAGLLFSASLFESRRQENTDLINSQALSVFQEYVSSIVKNNERFIGLGKELSSQSYERFVFLGSGPSYGIALEAALKFKETSYVSTEALYALEFRHGPIATVNEKQVEFIINPSGRSFDAVYRLYKDIVDLGGKTIRLSDRLEPDIKLSDTGVEELNALEAIVPLQYIAVGYALSRGLNPDKPRNLFRVVEKF